MPIERFRDFDTARRALWAARDDPNLAARIRRLWTIASRLVPLGIPRGIRKFRRIEDANRERDAWVERRVQAVRRNRASG
jgi:SH3-like domain-containing protein